MSSSVIHQVLAKKSIVKYLEDKHITPHKVLSGGKLSYLCPFPDHNESKPSFIVWTASEYENFHCFGCQRHHSIIDLVAGMEGLTFKEALERLAGDMEISRDEIVAIESDRCLKITEEMPVMKFELADTLSSISSLCRTYIDAISNDPSELGIIDKLYAQVDDEIANFEFGKLEETLRHLPDMLTRRREKFEELKIRKLAEKYAVSKND